MIPYHTPKHSSECWATLSSDNALLKAAFTSRASNTNAAIMVPQIEVRRRRIDEAGIRTPVAVDQHAVNCLEEAVQLFTAMWSRCRSSAAASVVHFQFVELFGAHWSTASKFASLLKCSAALKLLLREGLLEGRRSSPFKPRGSIRGAWKRPECHLQALQRFQDDGNVSRCYSTGRPRVTTPNEDRYFAVTAKKTDGAQHQTCLVSSLQLPVRQFQGRPCTDA
ncbi:uncharacterized protein TNCV_3858141 [Trichonephila clavipes]|nr:uncharacterized protein TNCV_3858141 [Trichonephila clavipes]